VRRSVSAPVQRGSLVGLLILSCCLINLSVGAGPVSPLRSLNVLWHAFISEPLADEQAIFVIKQLRLPRMIIGALVGAALACAGALLQSLTRNPLAEPGLLGVSAGSALAVTIAVAMGASAASVRVPVAQFGALAGCIGVLAVSRLRGAAEDPIRLVLAGVILSGVLGALTSMIMLFDERTADEIRFWVVGSLAGRRLSDLVSLWPGLLVAALLVLYVARPLAAMSLGEKVAAGLGHKPVQIRVLTILAVALLVGSATAIAGPIAFVGLVAPYITRAMAGPDIRKTLWLCLPVGPILVLSADVLSRVLVQPSEMPVGVVMALVGAPVLVAIVRIRRLHTL